MENKLYTKFATPDIDKIDALAEYLGGNHVNLELLEEYQEDKNNNNEDYVDNKYSDKYSGENKEDDNINSDDDDDNDEYIQDIKYFKDLNNQQKQS